MSRRNWTGRCSSFLYPADQLDIFKGTSHGITDSVAKGPSHEAEAEARPPESAVQVGIGADTPELESVSVSCCTPGFRSCSTQGLPICSSCSPWTIDERRSIKAAPWMFLQDIVKWRKGVTFAEGLLPHKESFFCFRIHYRWRFQLGVENESKIWRTLLSRMLDIIRFLAKQNIALCGHREGQLYGVSRVNTIPFYVNI